MHSLHLFNPSHDEALAAHSPYYYPARAARILERDLALLPTWWAQPGDLVLLPEEVPCPEDGALKADIAYVHLSDSKLWASHIGQICPWGWDPLLVRKLRQAGLPAALLPDEKQLEAIRQLSSRQSAVKLLAALHKALPHTIGTSRWCTTGKEVWDAVGEYHQAMLKAPWSSSGRGVFPATADAAPNLRQRVNKVLSLQGGIEVEPLYERVSDFAVEFFSTGTDVRYQGLSVFETNGNGAYAGNVIGTEQQLYTHLPETIREQLPEVIAQLSTHLQHLLQNRYVGPLGVDMMSVNDIDGQLRLHPCIEINLRRTMGHVALALRTEVEAHAQGIYQIRPLTTTEAEGCRRLTPGATQMEAILQYR